MLKKGVSRGNTPFWLNQARYLMKTVNFTPHLERAEKQLHVQNIVETSDFNETVLFELPRVRSIVLYMFDGDTIAFKLKRL